MSIPFTPWPSALAAEYRQQGFWIDRPLTDLLRGPLAERAEATALIDGDRHYSYAELGRLSDLLAGHIGALGLGVGDAALVQLPNSAEFYIVFFALLKAGVAPVNALFNHNRLELSAYVAQLQPKLAIVSSAHPLFRDDAFAAQLSQDCPALCHWLCSGESVFASPLAELFAVTEQTKPVLGPSAPDQVAFFQLSGGSTGTPKLIPRTHNDYYYSVRASAEICALSPNTRYLCALPAPHNFSLSSPGALGVLFAGGQVVLATDPSPGTCFPLIEQHRVSMSALVPPALGLWLDAAAEQTDALASLQLLQVGGARLSESQARRVEPELGCRLQQVFGMAEGLVNYTRLDDSDWHCCNTQGRPISPADEISIRDSAGNEVAVGEIGALWTRGPYTFRGYYNSPEHNRRAFDAEGFYGSGDLVQRTGDGYLVVSGRDKDQINRGGEKIAAEEIENLLLAHPEISQAALVAMPDALLGEKACAFIVSAADRLKPIKLRKHLRLQGVAEYKLPDRFEQCDALPMTAVGKIDKKLLRQRIAQQLQNKQNKDL